MYRGKFFKKYVKMFYNVDKIRNCTLNEQMHFEQFG